MVFDLRPNVEAMAVSRSPARSAILRTTSPSNSHRIIHTINLNILGGARSSTRAHSDRVCSGRWQQTTIGSVCYDLLTVVKVQLPIIPRFAVLYRDEHFSFTTLVDGRYIRSMARDDGSQVDGVGDHVTIRTKRQVKY